MKKSLFRALLTLAAVVILAAACGGSDGSIAVEDARYRVSSNDLGAGYFSVTNTTGSDVTLEAASAPGVGRIELHETSAGDDGTMSMQARPEGFVIAAGETVSLQPGGKHLMIFDPEGTDDLTITLDFGDETIDVVAAYDAEASAAAMSDDEMEEVDHSDHADDDHGDEDHDDDHDDHGDEDHDDHGDDHSDHGDDDHEDEDHADHGHGDEDVEDAMDDVEDAMDDVEDAMDDVEDAMDDVEDAMEDAG